MVVLYLRKGHEVSTMIEPTIATVVVREEEMGREEVGEWSVEELRKKVAKETNMNAQELVIMYGGSVLRGGKRLADYNIKDGCTLHLLPRQKRDAHITLPVSPEGMSVIFADTTVQNEMQEFVNDPELVSKMIPMGNPTRVQDILKDSDLMSKLSDLTRISHYIRHNSYIQLVMEALLKLHRNKYKVRAPQATPTSLTFDPNFIREMVERAGSGRGMEDSGRQAESERLASAQEAMFEHAQALHSQHQNPLSHPHPSHPLTSHSSGGTSQLQPSHQSGSSAVSATPTSLTPADLASALANIVTDHTPSQTPSLTPSQPHSLTPSQPHSLTPSQPHSLTIPNMDVFASSAPASLQIQDQLQQPSSSSSHAPSSSSSSSLIPPLVQRSLSDSGVITQDRGRRGEGSEVRGGEGSGTSITTFSLQNALSAALTNIQPVQGQASISPTTQSTRRRRRPPPPQPREDQLPLRDRYRAHLEQLHTMGIRGRDTECLHALEATAGNLQTALEILMGQ